MMVFMSDPEMQKIQILLTDRCISFIIHLKRWDYILLFLSDIEEWASYDNVKAEKSSRTSLSFVLEKLASFYQSYPIAVTQKKFHDVHPVRPSVSSAFDIQVYHYIVTLRSDVTSTVIEQMNIGMKK